MAPLEARWLATTARDEFLRSIAELRAIRREIKHGRGAFVTAILRLVILIARRCAHCSLPLSDLIQEGNLGLIKAVDRYDYRYGFRFSTYGSWWIRHAIGRAITDKSRAVRLPAHVLRKYNQVSRARRDLEGQAGKELDDGEVAGITGLSPERIRRMNCSLRQALSLDADSSSTLTDLQTPEVAEMIDMTRMLANLQDVLGVLSPMEVDILRKRMGMDNKEEEQTLQEIGKAYSLSRERIRQVQVQALQKLRAEFKYRDLL